MFIQIQNKGMAALVSFSWQQGSQASSWWAVHLSSRYTALAQLSPSAVPIMLVPQLPISGAAALHFPDTTEA